MWRNDTKCKYMFMFPLKNFTRKGLRCSVGLQSMDAFLLLTLNMLNCFKNYERYIHILNRVLDLTWPKLMALTLEQQYMLSALHTQYHACWWSGDVRSQSISRHGIDPQSENIPSPASEELIGMYCYLLHVLTAPKWSVPVDILGVKIWSLYKVCTSSWWLLLELISWCPIFNSSHCNSFEDWALVDCIYGCPILVWVAETWLHDWVPVYLSGY